MTRRYGRIGTAAATILLALAGASGSVFAADPAAGIAFEATLTVRFTDAVTLLPVDSAAVHVTARQADSVVGTYDATTDAAGIAVLTGLPRETADGPTVHVTVTADKATTAQDAETGCSLAETWHAERADVTVDALTVEVAFGETEQVSTSSITCPDAEPSGQVGGVIGTPAVTLPPTDTSVAPAAATSDAGAAVVVGFIFAMAGLSFVLRRPRGNRS